MSIDAIALMQRERRTRTALVTSFSVLALCFAFGSQKTRGFLSGAPDAPSAFTAATGGAPGNSVTRNSGAARSAQTPVIQTGARGALQRDSTAPQRFASPIGASQIAGGRAGAPSTVGDLIGRNNGGAAFAATTFNRTGAAGGTGLSFFPGGGAFTGGAGGGGTIGSGTGTTNPPAAGGSTTTPPTLGGGTTPPATGDGTTKPPATGGGTTPVIPPIILPVPEPSFWVLSILGFAFIGLQLRHKRTAERRSFQD